jgi:excisionase family DNA binding protein
MEATAVPTNRALTVRIAARRLSLSEKSVYRAIARGDLPAIRVGRAVRVPEAALERLLTPKAPA